MSTVPMRLSIYLRGVPAPTVLRTNTQTVDQVAELLKPSSNESWIALFSDAGEHPFTFAAARSDIRAISAEIDDAETGWVVLSPDVARSIVELLQCVRFSDADAERAADIIKAIS